MSIYDFTVVNLTYCYLPMLSLCVVSIHSFQRADSQYSSHTGRVETRNMAASPLLNI